MLVKIKQQSKRLSFQLLISMIVTCLPLNVLTILASGIVIYNSGQEVRNSYRRELNSVMEQFEEIRSKMDDDTDDFLLEHLTELMIEDEEDSITSYEMIQQLGTAFHDSGVVGMVYLNCKKNGQIYIKYTKGKYSIIQVEKIRELFKSSQPEIDSEHWVCQIRDHIPFLEKYYDYTNYQIGYLLDINENLKELKDEFLAKDSRLFFTQDALAMEIGSDELDADQGETIQKLSEKKLSGIWLDWNSSEKEYSAGLWLSEKNVRGSIPFWYWLVLAVALSFLFLSILFWKLLRKRVLVPLQVLQEGMKQLEQKNSTYRITDIRSEESEEFCYIYNTFNHMAEEIRLSHEKDIKMYQAQMDNLRLQVNPHMLLNSFNMIYSLAQSKNYKCIQEYSILLVEYFRYALKETDNFVPVEKELEFVNSYVEIQKIRFPDCFSYVYRIEEGTETAMVPPLLIENFVENAMKYAMKPGKVIEVLINIRRDADKLLISISDTGSGIKPEILECIRSGTIYVDKMGKKHIGIWNCRRRMEVFYGKDAKLNIISEIGSGTQVWLELPYREEKGDAGENEAFNR